MRVVGNDHVGVTEIPLVAPLREDDPDSPLVEWYEVTDLDWFDPFQHPASNLWFWEEWNGRKNEWEEIPVYGTYAGMGHRVHLSNQLKWAKTAGTAAWYDDDYAILLPTDDELQTQLGSNLQQLARMGITTQYNPGYQGPRTVEFVWYHKVGDDYRSDDMDDV